MSDSIAAKTLGVLIARFQVPYLHEAHRDLIKGLQAKHTKVVIVVGLAPNLSTRTNPLDFEARKVMLLESFPALQVSYLKDMPTDEVWSEKLDALIKNLSKDARKDFGLAGDVRMPVTLYGSADAFIHHYTGDYPAEETQQDRYVSEEDMRLDASKRARNSADFRAGVMHGTYNQFPKCLATVDVAIFNADKTKLLLGRKEDETQFRIVGGFSSPDPINKTYEDDALREVKEETTITISDPQYVGSCMIDDWRFRNEVDKIKTLLFHATQLSGIPKPKDDIVEVRWFKITELRDEEVVDLHRPLIQMLRAKGLLPASEATGMDA